MTHRALMVGAVGVLALAGCGAGPRHVPTFTAVRMYGTGDLRAGDNFRDFGVRNAAGDLTRLSAIRGRVTVLVFPAEPGWPACAAGHELAALACDASTWEIDVRVVSVGQPADACEEALARVADCPAYHGHLVFICDPYGRIPLLYGPTAVGRYFVLTNFLKIAAVGDSTDRVGLARDVRRAVVELFAQDLSEGAYEYDYADWWPPYHRSRP